VYHQVVRCNTWRVPTARPRHQITETDDIAQALEVAARRWPGESRSRLLLRLVELGSGALADAQATELAERRAAIEKTSGKYTGMYTDSLSELREDWPE
jgi:hypothetical protein